MRNRSFELALKIYGLIGKSLSIVAGAAIGFVLGGPFLAIGGILIGSLTGYLLEKGILKSSY